MLCEIGTQDVMWVPREAQLMVCEILKHNLFSSINDAHQHYGQNVRQPRSCHNLSGLGFGFIEGLWESTTFLSFHGIVRRLECHENI